MNLINGDCIEEIAHALLDDRDDLRKTIQNIVNNEYKEMERTDFSKIFTFKSAKIAPFFEVLPELLVQYCITRKITLRDGVSDATITLIGYLENIFLILLRITEAIY